MRIKWLQIRDLSLFQINCFGGYDKSTETIHVDLLASHTGRDLVERFIPYLTVTRNLAIGLLHKIRVNVC